MKNMGNMKSIAEIHSIIEREPTCIPLLQRNYKWSRECASELAEDLWDAFREGKTSYQLNMITIYKDREREQLQILDGQQRLITLRLLLSILEPGRRNLDFSFERDAKIDDKRGRGYFIHNLQGNLFEASNQNPADTLSVDVKRLWENYSAMLIPLSFRTVHAFYEKCLETADEKNTNELKANFRQNLNERVVFERTEQYFGSGLIQNEKNSLTFTPDETERILNLCGDFQKLFSNNSEDNEISDDEIRVSNLSDRFQEIWYSKVQNFFSAIKDFKIAEKYKDSERLADFIKNKVEMLYHETTSEPIDEFLNINENKTRFVVSDYIRANMISDNPVDGEGLTKADREKNQRNREEVLKLFAEISGFLYREKYAVLWELIRNRYDDFETHPDINRMKVVFCDKYFGTSTKGYKFEEELSRLRYFSYILDSLAREIGLETEEDAKAETGVSVFWNTYNAVYMLLECKERYRFFSLFTKEDIVGRKDLREVTDRERFCFFEEAYRLAKTSDDLWDISYFLESQLYKGKCNVKKEKELPNVKKEANEWYFVNRGNDGDELNRCISELIENIKRVEKNG